MKVLFGAKVTVERNGKDVVIDAPTIISSRYVQAMVLLEPPSNIVVIDEFPDTSAARDAGLRKGDKLIAVDGQPISLWRIQGKRWLLPKGGQVVVTVFRGKIPSP